MYGMYGVCGMYGMYVLCAMYVIMYGNNLCHRCVNGLCVMYVMYGMYKLHVNMSVVMCVVQWHVILCMIRHVM
jgi:hypothetical protein